MSAPTTVVPAPGQEPAVIPPVVPAVDQNAIASAVASGIAAHQQALQSQPKEMTAEQRAEYLQIYSINDGFLDAYHALNDPEATPETRRGVLEQFRDGVVNQALRGSEIFLDQRIEALRQEFAPTMHAQAHQQAEDVWSQFATKHPDLKDNRALVDTVSNQLYAAGFRGKDLDESFSRAASTTRSLLKLPEPLAANQSAPNGMPRMNQTNTTSGAAGMPPNTPEMGVASFFMNRKR